MSLPRKHFRTFVYKKDTLHSLFEKGSVLELELEEEKLGMKKFQHCFLFVFLFKEIIKAFSHRCSLWIDHHTENFLLGL